MANSRSFFLVSLVLLTLTTLAHTAEVKVGVGKSGQATIWVTGEYPAMPTSFCRQYVKPTIPGNLSQT
ncbi:hypothetical protein [Bradyrhizobium ottawaense]|uniref:hypothetical protein n=1 Tax=Bradyrhizobium ottawaense TaxID=931866 RepID=UPI001038D610|nr:hypothetical protein [Bradyrhizobium ottawaense]